ncbi:hypothetical protein CYMTET_11494 [Cymbomonas tetramitiformis]|uniref:Uncharacterized protein n=1 Tax=Cymbomonas tetramitiformis TaxID=36881 RepID=A0AAE0LCT2_9CHLO|nr:hypothetical protein CYMTET_11494 [Cymbomonas tetramitiformis]
MSKGGSSASTEDSLLSQDTVALKCTNKYCKIRLSFFDSHIVVTRRLFMQAINQAVVQMFGLVGGAMIIDLLMFCESKQTGFIKFQSRHSEQILSSLVCYTELYDSEHENSLSCRLEILDIVRTACL